MGVERAVTRWYVQRQVLQTAIAQLETQLAQATPTESSPSESLMVVQQELKKVREQLRLLGPCPRPMMG